MMKITIVTVVRNAQATIAHALRSVASQSYPHIEHLILDGASTDGTLEILQAFADLHPNVTLMSKPDKGMYHALNEGITLATGDVIGFLHADDFFKDSDVLKTVMAQFSSVDAVYGDLVYVDPVDIKKIRRYWQSCPYQAGAFARGWHPPHTALFIRKSIYQDLGGFDTSLPVGNDVELMMRFFEKHQISSQYIPKLLVAMRLGGISNRSLRGVWLQNKVIMSSFSKNNLSVSWPYFIGHKCMDRLKQFIRRPREVKNVA